MSGNIQGAEAAGIPGGYKLHQDKGKHRSTDRDISNLIDPVVQNFIYDNSLYLREPQYKNVFEAEEHIL